MRKTLEKTENPDEKNLFLGKNNFFLNFNKAFWENRTAKNYKKLL